MMSRLVWALVAGLVPALVGAEQYTCEFGPLPPWVVEGSRATVEIRYTTPAGVAPAALHCEMKDGGDQRYLSGQAVRVTGTGSQSFTVEVPELTTARQITLIGWFGDDWQQPFSLFARPAPIRVLSRDQGKELERMQAEAEAVRQRLAAVRTPVGLAGIYRAPDTEWAASLAAALEARLRQAGFGVAELDGALLANPYVLTPDQVDLLVLCDPRTTPATAQDAVERFVEAGGKAVFLGGPAFETATWQLDGRWLPTDEYRAALAAKLDVRVLLDFEADAGGEWRRGSNRPDSPATVERIEGGAEGSRGSLQITIADLTGWDTFRAPLAADPFPAGHSWTVFRATGDTATRELAVEWTEKDGSRWIAVTPLPTQWRAVALPPSAFRYWRDSASKGRGGEGDAFHPENAASLTVGLAFTHTAASGGGRHVFCLDNVGTAAAPEAAAREVLAQPERGAPRLEGVSPRYKLYRVSNLSTLAPSPANAILAPPAGLRAAATFAPHPRPQGTGFGKSRRWRYVPLLDCLDAEARVCGQAAVLVLTGATPTEGGAVLSLPVSDPAFFAAPALVAWVADLAARLHDGLFLYEGGSAWYASFGSERMPVGARVSNRGRQPARAEVTARVTTAAGQAVWEKRWPLEVAPGTAVQVEDKWSVPAAPAGPFQVTVELRRDGQVVDRLTHELRLWAAPAQPQWISRENGEFRLNGKPWFAHGVNYMPSTGIGIEDSDYFEYWLDPQPYDPELVERDLTDIQAMGMNMISVFQYHRSLAGRNLLDLLMRCAAHGLKVNLSLRPGTPMDFQWDQMREMIQVGRLARNDTVFAYDLAWEPFWRGHDDRLGYDRDWEAWVMQRYGSLEAAEKAWTFRLPRGADGRVTNPSNEQVSGDGPWRPLVLDYRQFLNDLLDARYGRARELVRSIDPHHLVSFRMSIGGDPTVDPAAMPYDFAGLARAVDILEPEGYGRIGDWERVKPGWFTTAYGRCVAPDLPVMWAEFGCSIWTDPEPPADRLAYEAAFYDDFYKMAYRSGANGTVCWWFPGGYRWNERSDFGIVNPDRSWRPVTHVIKRWAAKMTEPRPNPTPDVWLPVEPDRDPDGLSGLYRRLQGEFWQAVEAGRTPGLRLAAPPAAK